MWLMEDAVLDPKPRGSSQGSGLCARTPVRARVLRRSLLVPHGSHQSAWRWQEHKVAGIRSQRCLGLPVTLGLNPTGDMWAVPTVCGGRASFLLCIHREGSWFLAGPCPAEVQAVSDALQAPGSQGLSRGGGGGVPCRVRTPRPLRWTVCPQSESCVYRVVVTVEGVALLPGALGTYEGVWWSRPCSFHLSCFFSG